MAHIKIAYRRYYCRQGHPTVQLPGYKYPHILGNYDHEWLDPACLEGGIIPEHKAVPQELRGQCLRCYREARDTTFDREMSYSPCYELVHRKVIVEKNIKNYEWTGVIFRDGYVDDGYFCGGGLFVDARDIYHLEIDGEILQDFNDDDLGDWGPEWEEKVREWEEEMRLEADISSS